MAQKDLKIQESISGGKQSKLKRYQQLVIGSDRFSDLILYELVTTLFSWVPGALGLFLRSKLYPLLLGKTGQERYLVRMLCSGMQRKSGLAGTWLLTTMSCSMQKGMTMRE